jgi:hypothetical protein
MAYDQILAERIRVILIPHPEVVEKKMFGGVGFLLHGNMACGVQGDDVIVRVAVENNERILSQPFTRPFMPMPGKPMAGWILVAPEGTANEPDLQYWVCMGYEYALTLPEKK